MDLLDKLRAIEQRRATFAGGASVPTLRMRSPSTTTNAFFRTRPFPSQSAPNRMAVGAAVPGWGTAKLATSVRTVAIRPKRCVV